MFVSSHRSVEDGGLWSLTLENYILTNNLATDHPKAVRKLYGSADRLIYTFFVFNFNLPVRAVTVTTRFHTELVVVGSVCSQCLRAD